MPAASEQQRRFMGAELSRHRRGKKTRTDMSESKLEDFASKSTGNVMEKNVVKTIDRYLGKQETDEDSKTALAAFSTKPKTSKEAAEMVEGRRKFEEAAAKITPPKRVIAKENDYPPIKGESRDAKRAKAKKMKVTGAGTKNLQRIIGQKAKVAGGVDKQMAPTPKEDFPPFEPTQKPPPVFKPGFPRPAKPSKKVGLTGEDLEHPPLQRVGYTPSTRHLRPSVYDKENKVEKSVIKAISKFLRKQTSEVTTADPEAAKRAAARKVQEAGIGKPYPAPFVHTTPDPLTGKKPPKKPKASWAAIERPEGVKRTSAEGGGGMVAFGKKKSGVTNEKRKFKEEMERLKKKDPGQKYRIQPYPDPGKAPEIKSLIKAISAYIKEDTSKYNKKAVDAAIKRDKGIGKKEAKAIHGLLRGRQKSDS